MRNGQHINNDYITGINPTAGTITLTFTPDQGDDITLIWFVEEFVNTKQFRSRINVSRRIYSRWRFAFIYSNRNEGNYLSRFRL